MKLKTMCEVLSQIVERFTKHTPEIADLYMRSGEFRNICHDYMSCAEALRRLAVEPVTELASLREYQLLEKELRGELLQCVERQCS